MEIPDHLICLLQNLYTGQEANSQNWTWDNGPVQIGRRISQGSILSPCLFNLCAEYIMRNAGLEEAQAGIKLLGEISITSDMQMTPQSCRKQRRTKEPQMKMKEESEKVCLKLNIQNTKIIASSPITYGK